jgi:chromosome segregation ATPase
MNDDLRRYKTDLNDAILTIKGLEKEIDDSNYRNKKIITQLERDVKDKYTKLEDFVKSTDSEISRLRKDRDSMRQMYEQTNALLSSCQKQLSSYQKNINCSEAAIHQLTEAVGKLKSHIQLIPNITNDSSDLVKAIETLRADEQLYIDELENLGKAFEQLQNENASLVMKIADRDDQISKLLGDKLKAEFSFSQIQKEAESSLERAQKIEEIAKQRINEAESREDTLRRQVVKIALMSKFAHIFRRQWTKAYPIKLLPLIITKVA